MGLRGGEVVGEQEPVQRQVRRALQHRAREDQRRGTGVAAPVLGAGAGLRPGSEAAVRGACPQPLPHRRGVSQGRATH
eukprot:225957-Lingulodinium_polyedra.AAC.1